MKKKFSKKEVDTLIFDVDGTLFNGKSLSLPIFKECLSKVMDKFSYDLSFPSDTEILSYFGKQTKDIYPNLLVNATPEIIASFGECVEKTEITQLNNDGGKLFTNVPAVLTTLKDRGYKLAICTNARKDYFYAIVERFNFGNYFELMLAAGLFDNKDKKWMVAEIIKKLGTKNFAVIGDRYHDIEAAKANNGLSVGCAYGFGLEEVKKANLIINNIEELLAIFL